MVVRGGLTTTIYFALNCFLLVNFLSLGGAQWGVFFSVVSEGYLAAIDIVSISINLFFLHDIIKLEKGNN